MAGMSDFAQQVYDIAARRDRRYKYRWVLAPKHIQAFHDEENERRREERIWLLKLSAESPNIDFTESLRWNQPLPPPDYGKVDEWQLLGWPIRIADVDEITLEPVRERRPWDEWEWDETWP